MSDGFEHISLPNGSSLWYRDKDHFYARHNAKTGKKGTRLTGVTTVVKVFDLDPSRLMKAAAKNQCVGVAERLKEGGGSWTDSGDSIWEEMVTRELTYDDLWAVKRDTGTNVHKLGLEALGKGQPVPQFDYMTEAEVGHAMGVTAFFLDHEPQIELCEQIVYSEQLGVAGRLDLFSGLNSRDGHGVIDLKTGGFISTAANLQVGGGYTRLLRESHGIEADWALILHTREDGTYRLLEAMGDDVESELATPADFELAVQVYRRVGRINGAAARVRKEPGAVAA